MHRIFLILFCFLFSSGLLSQILNGVPYSPITLKKEDIGREQLERLIKTKITLLPGSEWPVAVDSIEASNARTERKSIRIMQAIWAIRQQKKEILLLREIQDEARKRKELKRFFRKKLKNIPLDESDPDLSIEKALSFFHQQLGVQSALWDKNQENLLFYKSLIIPEPEGDTAVFWAENVLLACKELERNYASLDKRLEITELKELSRLQFQDYATMEVGREISQIWVYFYEGGIQTAMRVVAKYALLPYENLNYEGNAVETGTEEFQNYREHLLGNMDMIAVKGESYLNKAETGGAPSVVTGTGDFYLGKTEVTVAQFRLFCEATNRKMPNPPSYGWKENHPISGISWNEAVAFCQWLSGVSGKNYTLPAEKQWEWAARGVFGDSPDALAEMGWHYDNSDRKPHRTGAKKPNEYGMYDMAGNVWEFTLTDYQPEMYPSVKNPNKEILNYNEARFKVLKGGSSWDTPDSFHLNARFIALLTDNNFGMGFRLCRSRGGEEK